MAANQSHEAIAREFWRGTSLDERFPRDIEKAVALKLPLALVKLPRITVPAIRQWLHARRLRAQVPHDQRELMGCLVAYRGFGIIFVCGADPIDEQRLTLTHETAHFLQDYLLPRQGVIEAFGEGIADVLDGARLPTPVERANAVLVHVRLGAHVHLLPRNGKDEDSDPVVATAEYRADGLGLELVAPRNRIASLLRVARRSNCNADSICSQLASYFCLPEYIFRRFTERTGTRVVSFLDDIRPGLERTR